METKALDLVKQNKAKVSKPMLNVHGNQHKHVAPVTNHKNNNHNNLMSQKHKNVEFKVPMTQVPSTSKDGKNINDLVCGNLCINYISIISN